MTPDWISRSSDEIAEYFYGVRHKYAEFESPVNNQIKTDVLISQIPGGMLSNLVAQLRQQKAEDKLEAVLAEMPHVRKDLGLSAAGDADESDLRLPGGAQCHDRQALFRRRDGNKKLCHGAVRRSAGPDQRRDQKQGARQKAADHLPPGGSAEARASTRPEERSVA